MQLIKETKLGGGASHLLQSLIVIGTDLLSYKIPGLGLSRGHIWLTVEWLKEREQENVSQRSVAVPKS